MKNKLISLVGSGALAVGYLVASAYADDPVTYCVDDDGTICRVCQGCFSGECVEPAVVVAAANCTDEDEEPECTLEVVDGVVSYSAECVSKSPTPIGGPGGVD